MSLTVDHGRIRTEKFPGDPGRVGNDKEGVSGGVGLQSHAIDQDADNVENRWFLDYYDDDEKTYLSHVRGNGGLEKRLIAYMEYLRKSSFSH